MTPQVDDYSTHLSSTLRWEIIDNFVGPLHVGPALPVAVGYRQWKHSLGAGVATKVGRRDVM